MSTRWRSLPALLVIALLLTACGGDAPGTAEPTTAPPADEETAEPTPTPEATTAPAETPTEEAVTRADADIVIWADDTRTPVLQPFAEEFGAANDVSVAVQEVSFDQLRSQFLVAAPAGQGPDIIIGAHDWLGELVTNGVVAPIELTNPGDYQEVAVEAFSYDGQLYGLPYAIENIALIRNTDLVPDAPATFEELEETALALQEDGTVELGLALQADPPDPYHNYPLFSAMGGYVFAQNEDGSYNPDDIGIDSPGGLAAADKFAEWVQSGLINPSTTYDIMIDTFGSGRAAFAITGPWAVAQPDNGFDATGVPYAVSPIPPVDGGTPQPFVGVQGFMVSSFSENALLAQTFLQDFMGTEEAQLALFEAGARPPALISAFDQVADDPAIQGFGESGANGVPLPAIPEMGSVWTAWTDAYALIYQGEGEPQEHFRNAAEQIRTLIGQ